MNKIVIRCWHCGDTPAPLWTWAHGGLYEAWTARPCCGVCVRKTFEWWGPDYDHVLPKGVKHTDSVECHNKDAIAAYKPSGYWRR